MHCIDRRLPLVETLLTVLLLYGVVPFGVDLFTMLIEVVIDNIPNSQQPTDK